MNLDLFAPWHSCYYRIFKRQNMNYEFSNQQSEMELAARLPGLSLCRVPPKLSLEEIELDVNFDVASENSSQRQLPKFPTLKHCQKLKQKKPQENAASANKSLVLNINAAAPISYSRKTAKSFKTSLVEVIIWVCYFISTAQSKFVGLDLIGVIDIAGIGISVAYCLYRTFLQSPFQLSDMLHIISLATTLTLYLYTPANSEDSFNCFMIAIRSLRLLFPLNYDYAFKDLIHKYFLFLATIMKSILKLAVAVVFLALIMQQSAYGTIYNRCRQGIANNNSQSFAAVGTDLCGSQLCQQAYSCLNPQSYDLVPEQGELYNSALSYGLFSFTNLYSSSFSILSLGTLAQTAEIFNIYSKSLETYFLAIVVIIVLFVVQFAMNLILMKAVAESTQNGKYQLLGQPENNGQSKEELTLRFLSRESLEGEGCSNALTFGAISSRQPSAIRKSSHSLKINKEQAQSVSKTNKQSQLNKSHQVESINKTTPLGLQLNMPEKQLGIKQQPSVIHTIQKQEQFQSCQIFKLVLYGCIGLSQFALSLLFSLGCLDESSNRTVGVTLCCLWIIWTFATLYQLYSKHFSEEKQQQSVLSAQLRQNKQTMSKIQTAVYLVTLFDYICRLFQQGYALESVSPLTPLATALLFLRVVYLFLALEAVPARFTNFNRILKVFLATVESLLIYILFVIILSAILCTWTGDLFGGTTYFAKLSIFFSTLVNSNWLQQYRHLGYIHETMSKYFGYILGMNFALVAIGQIILLKLALGQAVACSSSQIFKKDVRHSLPSIEREITEQQTLQILRQQKSLYLFQFDSKIRKTIYSILQSSNYKGFRLMLLKAYIWITFFGYIIDKESATYSYLLQSIDIVLLCDSLMSVVALRFWGKCSFINYQWYNFVNFIVSFATVANSFQFVVDCFFLRPFRLLLLLKQSQQFKNSYTFLQNLSSAVLQLLPLVAIVLIFNFIICTNASFQRDSRGILQILLTSLVNAVLMFQKGFDWQTDLQLQNDSFSLYSFQSSAYFALITMALNGCAIALMVKQLLHYQEQKQKLCIKEMAEVSGASLSMKAVQEFYEQQKIVQEILAMQPQTDARCYLQQTYLTKLCTHRYFYYSKMTACILSGVMLVLLGCIGQSSPTIIFKLKIARLFFCILQIFMFLLESLAFECNLDHFTARTVIYAVTTPGNFIMLVPFHKISASNTLKSVLTIFISLPPLTFINLYLNIKDKSKSLLQKYQKSLAFLTWFFIIGWFLAGVLSVCLGKSFLEVFAYVILGFFGGKYSSFIEANSVNIPTKVIINTINVLVVLSGFLLRNGLIAVIIFQLNHTIKSKMQLALSAAHKSTFISRKNVRKLFSCYKFMKTWDSLDLEGSGVLSYSLVLHNLPKFMKALPNSSYYIQYILQQKEQAYLMKLALLKKLQLPIRIANRESQEGQRQTAYVITLYDLAARLVCVALQQEYCQRVSRSSVSAEANVIRVKHLQTYLEFDTPEWNQKVSRRISKISAARRENNEGCSKFSLQKKIDLDSSVLVCVLNLLPKLRRRVVKAKAKFQ